MNLNGRSPLELPVPDLAALSNGGQVDPAQWAQATILANAGVERGGRSMVVVAGDPTGIYLDGTDVLVMALPAGLTIMALVGRDDEGRPVTIPWHAVQAIRSAP